MKETIQSVSEKAQDTTIQAHLRIADAREALKRRMRRGVGRRQGGATIVEYALLVGLIAVAAVAGISAFGAEVSTMFEDLMDEITAG